MKVIKTLPEIRLWRDQNSNETIALVPTMGFLHEGHLSLIREARKHSELIVLSIYINPTQFAPGEDLEQYPRNFDRDENLCRSEGVDIVFYPSNGEMYLPEHKTYVITEELSMRLCGQSRPKHFRGVTTVVAKLFNIVQPHVAVFGQKDAQQAIIIQRMATDLSYDINIVIAPIVRETDGLAMSSRNKYLNTKQRTEAVVLRQSLQLAQGEFKNSNSNLNDIKEQMKKLITENSSAKIDYIEFTDAISLGSPKPGKGKILVALAAWFNETRLIDNIVL